MNDFFGVAALAKDLRAFVRMFFRGVMFGVGPTLVIEIVEEAGEAPGVFVATELLGVGANAGFDGQGVLSRLSLCVYSQRRFQASSRFGIFSSGIILMQLRVV